MAGTITGETKREGQRRAKIRTAYRHKKWEKANPSHGGKLSHPRPL